MIFLLIFLRLKVIKPLLNGEKEDEAINELFNKYFKPLISNQDSKISIEEAKRNLRNVNVLANCDATRKMIKIENLLEKEMESLGYKNNEIKEILSQMCLFPFQTAQFLGDFKTTTISFADFNDDCVDINIRGKNRVNYQFEGMLKDNQIGETFKPLSKNEAIYVIDGSGYHNLKKYMTEGKLMPVIISRFISNAIENSIKNSVNDKEFIPISLRELIKNSQKYIDMAKNGIEQEKIMKEFDNDLQYTNASKTTNISQDVLKSTKNIANNENATNIRNTQLDLITNINSLDKTTPEIEDNNKNKDD